MALSRIKTWVREKLTFNDLNSEFNNIVDYINAFVLTNPWSSDTDAGGYFLNNVKLKKAFRIRNAEHFDGIQEAVNDIVNDSDGATYQGGIVYLPPGVWTLTSNVTMYDDIYIVGSGWLSIVKKNYQDDVDDEMFLFDGVDRGGLLNFKIDGEQNANSNGGNGVAGVRIDQCDDLLIDRMFITGMGASGDGTSKQNDGIYIGNTAVANRNWITRCRITANARNGISVTYADHLNLLDNKLQGNLHAGIDIEPETGAGVNYAIVRGNNCQSNTSYGIVISNGGSMAATDYGCQRLTCTNNLCFGNTIGIYGLGNFASVYSNNVCADNTGSGLIFNQCKELTVANNSSYSNDEEGIRVGGDQASSNVTEDVTVVGNNVRENGGTGINLGAASGTTRNIVISSNTCFENGGGATANRASISAGGITGALIITGNALWRSSAANLEYGIRFADANDDVILTGNFTEGHATFGLSVGTDPTGDFELGHNIFKDGSEGVLT